MPRNVDFVCRYTLTPPKNGGSFYIRTVLWRMNRPIFESQDGFCHKDHSNKIVLSSGMHFGYNKDMEFLGFTQQTFTFFMELAFHNTPQTMQQKRDVFEAHVLSPLRALSSACEQVLFAQDPKIDFRPVMGGTISRIRRDTRFSNNKQPYRDYMWLDFRRKNEDFHLGFCFSVSPRGSLVLMGMHEASTQAKNRMRQYAVQYQTQFIELHEELRAQGYTLCGEDYKRPMTADVPPQVYAFGQKRWFSYQKAIPLTDTMQEKFAQELQGYMLELSPMYAFLRRALN